MSDDLLVRELEEEKIYWKVGDEKSGAVCE